MEISQSHLIIIHQRTTPPPIPSRARASPRRVEMTVVFSRLAGRQWHGMM